jgi:DNA-directed RNA polymerase II subunit RPB1
MNNEIAHRITSINMSVFGNDEIRRYSVASNGNPLSQKAIEGFNIAETVDKGQPVIRGVLDPQLGTTNFNRYCTTCGLSEEYCPCHFGHIQLPVNIYNEGYMGYVRKQLSCLCLECSKIPLPPNHPAMIRVNKLPLGKRLDYIRKSTATVKECPYCGALKPKIKKESKDGVPYFLKTYLEKTEEDTKGKMKKEQLISNKVFSILDIVSDTTSLMLGTDPTKYKMSDLMIHNFPISPLSIRPSITADYLSSGVSEDPLTALTLNLVKQANKINETLKNFNQIKDAEKKIQNNTNLMQLYASSIRNNSSKDLPKTEQKGGGVPIKGIKKRLEGKEGLLRSNLEGKRTNFCARTVISSDPNLSIEEVGVPMHVAMVITIPVTVTEENINELSLYVRNGNNKWPGANYVFPKSVPGSSIKRSQKSLKHNKNSITLRPGDVVERHMIDGDVVLCNRQPSLHRMSVMAHRAHIIRDPKISVFRFNVNVTTPYNADFDGDEMNMYVPQSVQTRVEALRIAAVSKNIVSPGKSMPIISFKQDTPAGLYLLTFTKKMIPWYKAMNIARYLEGIDPTKIGKKDVSSHSLFSLIIPNKINIVKGDKALEIVNGELLHGSISGSILSELIMSIWNRYGAKTTRIFIDNAQRLAEQYIFMSGMSVGYKDTLPTKEIREHSVKVARDKVIETYRTLTEIENNPDMLDAETVESDISARLNATKSDLAGFAYKNLDNSNSFYILVESKAKGSPENISEMMTPKGQDVFASDASRMPKMVNGRGLPHLPYNSNGAKERGFIMNSYNSGVDPTEFWYSHQAAREGLINTAIKTADTGYQQRRLIKALESISVMYDGTVRTSNGVILQLIYGDNHIDQTMQKQVILKSLELNNADINKIHNMGTKESQKFVDELIMMRDTVRQSQRKYYLKYNTFITKFFQAVNYKQIIDEVKNTIDGDVSKLTHDYIMKQIDYILDHKNTPILYFNNKNIIRKDCEKKFKFMLKYCLYEYLSPKVCIEVHKLNKTKFDTIVNEIITTFKKSLVSPGEMVGITAAQSVGEPLTQLTLSSFHKAGSGVAGLQGGPRLKEILGYVKNIGTPLMFIYLKDEYRGNSSIVEKIAAKIKYTTLNNIVEKIVTIYDPYNTYSKEDNMDTSSIVSISGDTSEAALKRMSWLYKLHVDREAMFDSQVSMLDIKLKFMDFWNNVFIENKKNKPVTNVISDVCILTNDINSPEPFIHIRADMSFTDDSVLKEFRNLLMSSYYIKGTDKITSIEEIAHDESVEFDKDGNVVRNKEYVIYTNGIDYDTIRKIDEVDQNRTICNDTKTIYQLYGIEAARAFLLREISAVFEGKINHHTVALIADLMTHTGDITSIDRFGLNKLDIGLLAKATFEKTMEIFTEAAVHNQVDPMNNVSSCIMFGKPFKGGTGLCSVMLDNEILENAEFGKTNINTATNMSVSRNEMIQDTLDKEDINIFMPALTV